MNTNKKRAVVITRSNPNLNFGQTLDVLNATRTNAVVRPDGYDSKYTVDISEIWFSENAHNYEAYNAVVTKVNGWPWQNR